MVDQQISPERVPAPEPADPLARALVEGAPRVAGANDPILLTDDVAVHVLTGELNCFLRLSRPGQHGEGRRFFVCSVPPGSLLWLPRDVVPSGWQLLATGSPGTDVVEVPGELLEAEASAAAVRARLVDLAVRVSGRRVPDAEAREDPASVIRGALLAETQAAQRVLDTEGTSISSAVARHSASLEAALTGLVRLMDGEVRPPRPELGQVGHLDDALDDIGAHLGVTFHADALPTQDPTDHIGRRIRSARCRTRVVTLEPGWWRRPDATLLGFTDDGTTPVALLPQRSGYVLRDPSDGTRRRVDEAWAARIARTAYAIYTPFPDQARTGRIVRSTLRGARTELVLLLVFGLLAGIVNLLVPLVVSAVFSSVLPTRSGDLLFAVTALLAGGAVTLALVTYTQNLVTVRLSGKLAGTLEPALTDRLLRLPSDFFRRYDTGDLATRAIGIQQIRQMLSASVFTSLLALVFSLASVAVVFIYSPPLAIVALVLIAIVLGLLVALNVRIVRHGAEVQEEQGALAAMLYQVARSVAKVRVAGAEQRVMARWAEGFRRQQSASYRSGRAQVWVTALTAALPAAVALALYGAVSGGLAGDISAGRFLGLFTALGQFTAALTAMIFSLGPLLAVVPLWRRVRLILDEPIEVGGEEDPGVLTGRISVRNVSFAYGDGADGGSEESGDTATPAEPTGQVLSEVSLDIEPGQYVAITGPSGSGKSTLLRLLLGLDTPTAGVIRYDGKDLRALDASLVRRQFGVVLQNATPLPGALRNTILGDSGLPDEEAWRAAADADLADDIRRMPMGMQTIIGEGGLAFSGGQLQRMMIARALARRPAIIFLDEATSALDERTQATVSSHLDRLAVTRVAVAHRLSTIRNADRIYVLDQGRIAESGTFDELMAREGPFQRLARRQMIETPTP